MLTTIFFKSCSIFEQFFQKKFKYILYTPHLYTNRNTVLYLKAPKIKGLELKSKF